MYALDGKIALITGAGRGIGRAIALRLAREGCDVALCDLNPAEDTADEVRALGRRALFVQGDVTDEAQVTRVVEQTIAGLGQIDILVNNAGIQRYSTVTETTVEEWDLVMNVNLKSAFLCAKHAIPSMQKRGKGVVINIASVQALLSQPKVAPYTTAKTAMLGLTRSIAVDYAPIIRCVAVCPGAIDTPMLQTAVNSSPDPEAVWRACEQIHLLNRVGTANEIAEVVAHLASDAAGFITGQAIRVDGGIGVTITAAMR